MPEPLKKIAEARKALEELKEKRARAQGRLETLEKSLEEEFGVKTLEAGKKALAKLQKKVASQEAALEKKVDEFEEVYGALLF